MRKVLLALLTALGGTVAVITGAVFGLPADEPAPDEKPPTFASIPLAAYDTADLAVTRGSFCGAVPEEAVAEAVGGEPASATAYGNGDRVRLSEALLDVAHEFGCKWAAPGATARAWVFAPPVTPRSARELARAVRTAPGCEPVAEAPAFGKPSSASVCEAGRRVEVSYRGLFGDAWLTCTLSSAPGVPGPELVDRAGRWCVAVAEAARTR